MTRKRQQPTQPMWQPDAVTPRDHHRLAGLEPDNLLAFMALLGLVRALESVRPEWRPRVFWDVTTHPWRPVLTLAEAQTEAAVAEAAAEGVRNLASYHVATGEQADLRFLPEDFLRRRETANPEERFALDALCCFGAQRDRDTLWPTPFAFMFGQGHQHFLSRFRQVPAETAADSLASVLLAAALFVPWKREDLADSFRWDPAEDRRYALRAVNPSDDKGTTQQGANALAAVCLPLFQVIAIRRRDETRVLTAMTRYGRRGQIEFTWPLWTRRTSLAGILALLHHPELSKDTPEAAKMPQTATIMRARRISVGKFFNITPAEPPTP